MALTVIQGPSLTNVIIKFAAAQNASADVNTLDDYEEGSFTPVIGGAGGTSGQTYGQQLGRYVKVGRLVHVQGYVQLTAKGTITGGVQLQGLPFTTLNVASVFSVLAIGYVQSLITSVSCIMTEVGHNGTVASLYMGSGTSWNGTTAMNAGDINNTFGFEYGGTYLTEN
jgi:hypothetical protein